MNLRRFTYFQVFLLVSLLVGVTLRFYNLGKAPLSDAEAVWANQAFQVSQGQKDINIGPQPAYIILTAGTFYIFGATNFTARFWPTLAGCLLILAPIFLVSFWGPTHRGKLALSLLFFGLAVDPGLVTLSRQAGGPMMAAGFGLLALATWLGGRKILSGIAVGLALLSGPAIWPGILGLSAAGLLTTGLLRLLPPVPEESPQISPIDVNLRTAGSRNFALTALATFVLVGSGFFLVPQGLAAWTTSIRDYLIGWRLPEVIPPAKLVVSLVVYELLPLIFFLTGLIGSIVQIFKDNLPASGRSLFPFLWTGTALILAIIYPARQVSDLVWVLIPIWIVASWKLAQVLPRRETPSISIVLAIFVFILFALFWYTISALSRLPPQNTGFDTRNIIPLGVLVLIGLSTALVSLSWNYEAGFKGLVWGLSGALMVYTIAVLVGSAYLRPNSPIELWGSLPGPGQASLLEKTINDLSNRSKGRPDSLNITLLTDSPSLEWLLRRNNVIHQLGPNPDETPEVVILRETDELPGLAASYSGQDFTWWQYPGWNGILPLDLVGWLNYRKAPIFNDKIVLWVRTDLFPGGVLAPAVETKSIP